MARGQDTMLKQIIRLMEDAQMSKAPIQALADKIAGSFALVVLVISFMTFLIWFILLEMNLVGPNWIPEDSGSAFVLAFTLGVSTMVSFEDSTALG
jgi:P-type Cu+ transporter